MHPHEQPKFADLIQALAATFRVEPSPALYEGYWLGLQSLELADVSRAVGIAIGTKKFMPVPADLRELCGEAPVAMLAVQAWAALRRAAGQHGAYASVDFGPIMNATIRAMGGWQRFCTEENNDFVRKDFEKTFAVFATIGAGEDQARYLVGLHEMSNRSNGYEFDPPVMIQGVPKIENKKAIASPSSREVRGYIEGILDDKEPTE